MTVITERITDLAGTGEVNNIPFFTKTIRENADGTAIITTARHDYTPDAEGDITTDDLDPGPAVVRIGMTDYPIVIPDSGTPVRLWPLIEAMLPVPDIEQAHAVINGGGVYRIVALTAAEYADLVSTTTPDPGSVFLVF